MVECTGLETMPYFCSMKERMQVRLEEMILYGYHGLYEEEKKNGNDFLLNVVMEVEAKENMSLDDSVDYVKVKEDIVDEFDKAEELMENLAHRIAHKIMRSYSTILELELEVKKLNPPMDVQLKSSAVKICLKR